MNTRQFFQGIKAGFAIGAGYFPIAVAFGALAMEAGLGIRDSALMSVLVFAGASQFMAAGMFLAGAGGLQIIAATFFVNLRHLVMSLSVHHRLEKTGRGIRALVSFGITDEMFAFLTLHTDSSPAAINPFFTLGLNTTAYLGWVSGTVVGCLSAQIIPGEISTAMTFGLYALFIGLLMPSVQRSRAAAVVAGASMVLNTFFSLVLETGWAMVLATILGAVIGTFVTEGES
ncbi:MAG: AzlC family ABC transporter permease [Anaerolineales bacterium]|nr:AzlC family ABC transporter permease [Anaerolineales bacterium]